VESRGDAVESRRGGTQPRAAGLIRSPPNDPLSSRRPLVLTACAFAVNVPESSPLAARRSDRWPLSAWKPCTAVRENQQLRRLLGVYSQLSGLASQDTGVDGVVRLVARRTRAAVVVLSPAQQVLAAAPADAADRLTAAIPADRLAPVLAAAAQHRRPISVPAAGDEPGTVAVAPIPVGTDMAAYLISIRSAAVADGPAGSDVGVADGLDAGLDSEANLLLTEHAATICGVILGRERAVVAAGARARTELIEGLLLARDRADHVPPR